MKIRCIWKNYYLIIGKNLRLTDILKEFTIADKNEKYTVVFLSEIPKEDIDEEIELALHELNKLNIVTLKGKITSPAVLERISVDTAKAIIVLSSYESFSEQPEKDKSYRNIIKIVALLPTPTAMMP